MSDISLIEVCG